MIQKELSNPSQNNLDLLEMAHKKRPVPIDTVMWNDFSKNQIMHSANLRSSNLRQSTMVFWKILRLLRSYHTHVHMYILISVRGFPLPARPGLMTPKGMNHYSINIPSILHSIYHIVSLLYQADCLLNPHKSTHQPQFLDHIPF